jgi:hypothetical protein
MNIFWSWVYLTCGISTRSESIAAYCKGQVQQLSASCCCFLGLTLRSWRWIWYSSETPNDFHRTTRRYIPEDRILQTQARFKYSCHDERANRTQTISSICCNLSFICNEFRFACLSVSLAVSISTDPTCALSQAVSRRLPTAAARVRSMWDLWWTKWQWGASFLLVIRFPLPTVIPPTAPYMH